jgi:polysaccharide pyruvyl transferase WcaK-like protein
MKGTKQPRQVRVAHLASFKGNFGDIANHLGFRKWFAERVNHELQWHEIEIRDFYRGLRKFDSELVAELNKYDLVVIGGGNYFELWPENTRTGCSIDLPRELLIQVVPPVFFNALGVDDGQGVGIKAQEFFPGFVRYILDSEKCFLSIRNDGAESNLKRNFIEFEHFDFNVTPDHGFFALKSLNGTSQIEKTDSTFTIGINLAQDMNETRFGNRRKEILSDIRNAIMQVKFDRLILFPHIVSDLEILYELISPLPDLVKREKVSISPLGNHELDVQSTFDNYQQVDVMISMRFHANVIPLSMGTPTIGISTYPQISNLFNELGISNWCTDAKAPNTFPDELARLLRYIAVNREQATLEFGKVPKRMSAERDNFGIQLSHWLNTQGFSTF